MGAARFLRGLHSIDDPRRLTIVVNTADDETFFGLHVSPDLDTVTYTLAGRVDPRQGWGVEADTFQCLKALRRYYASGWFRLGDLDLATHIFRTDRLAQGESLSQITAEIARRHGLAVRLLPMSNDPVRTIIDLHGHGEVPFQEYLVKRRGRGRVRAVRFAGADTARPCPGVLSALRQADVVIVPPSNPLVSIDPILSLPGVRPVLQQRRRPVAAVSPLIGGRPVKGPLDRMLVGLGLEANAVGVASLYRDFVDLFVIDRQDAELAPQIRQLGMTPLVVDTLMRTASDSRRLASAVLRAVR